jgi:hypothetical protein
MSQILNIHEIKTVLNRRNKLHAKLMLQACYRALEHDRRCLREVTECPVSLPAGITREQFEQRKPFYMFVLHPDAERELRRINRWLKEAIKRKEPWINNVDGDARVARLRNIKTLAEALALCREDEQRFRRTRLAERDLALGNNPAHVRVLQASGEDAVFVELMTQEALRWEGQHMRHCLGRRMYVERLASFGFQYFSLRDRRGRPRVTLEVADGRITQCKGTANSDPFLRYGKAIEELAEAQNWECDDPSRPVPQELLEELDLDRMLVDHDMLLSAEQLPLPRTLYVDSAFEAINLQGLTALPVLMSVRGNLAIRNCHNLRFMPKWLQVLGDAVIENCSGIQQLASNFHVRGSLVLHNCPQVRINPAKTIVEGALEVRKCPNAGIPPRQKASSMRAHPTRRPPIAR